MKEQFKAAGARAGRTTGNALDLTYVAGHRANLPRLHDPLSMVNGAVRPPATWLSAEEILRRQYFAHVIDEIARDTSFRHPTQAPDALAAGQDGFLGQVVRYAEAGASRLLDRFIGAFDQLQPTAVARLRQWATAQGGPGTSGLAGQVYAAAGRWQAHVEDLEYRRRAIQETLPELVCSSSPRDAGQHLNVLELTQVSAQLQRDEAAIGDVVDDRRQVRFTVVTATDINLAEVGQEWFVQGYDFGAQYLERLTLRWLNGHLFAVPSLTAAVPLGCASSSAARPITSAWSPVSRRRARVTPGTRCCCTMWSPVGRDISPIWPTPNAPGPCC